MELFVDVAIERELEILPFLQMGPVVGVARLFAGIGGLVVENADASVVDVAVDAVDASAEFHAVELDREFFFGRNHTPAGADGVGVDPRGGAEALAQ